MYEGSRHRRPVSNTEDDQYSTTGGGNSRSRTSQQPVSVRTPPANRSLCRRIVLHCGATILCLILFPFVSVFLMEDVLIHPMPLVLPARPPLVGALSPNTRLTSTKKLHQTKGLLGPESMIYYNGSIYASVHHGVIVKIDGEEITQLARLGPPNCKNVPTCGRPLGLRLSVEDEMLFAVDAYLGLFRVSMQNGSVERLFPPENSTATENQRYYFEDVVLLPEPGKVLVTSPAQQRPYHEFFLTIMESRPEGRVLLIDYLAGTHEVLASNMHFPAGLELSSRDPDSVLVSEKTLCHIRRLFWRGPKKGRLEELISGQMAANLGVAMLPGFPDNIRRSELHPGTYWVALVVSRHAGQWPFLDWVLASPWAKRAISRILPVPLLHLAGSTKYGLIVRMDDSGSVVESLHDPTGHISSVTEVLEVNKTTLFLGSYYLPFLGSLSL